MGVSTTIISTRILLITIFSFSVFGLETCFNESSREICFNSHSSIYEQNIGLFDGNNDRYGVYVTNPDDELNQNWFNSFVNNVKGAFSSGKIKVSDLGDETSFSFESPEDFYNLAQQKNALGNVTLFTSEDLNTKQRELTLIYTNKVIDWNFLLLLVAIETFKLIISLGVIIGSIFILFRGIPFSMNKMKFYMVKFIVRGKNK